jgi:hypothetical protein
MKTEFTKPISRKTTSGRVRKTGPSQIGGWAEGSNDQK